MWKRVRDWIEDNGDAIKFMGWVIAGCLAIWQFIVPLLGHTYTQDFSEKLAPEERKFIIGICDGNDVLEKWDLLALPPRQAAVYLEQSVPIRSGEKTRGIVNLYWNGAGQGMNHPTLDWTVRITCRH